jgi:hypothetical protein
MQIRFLLAVLALGGTLAACGAHPTEPTPIPQGASMDEGNLNTPPPPPPGDSTGRGGHVAGSGG